MPTYEYQCPLGHQFEKFQRITENPRTKCPECGKAATRKISGGAGFVFKGSGFYITDYGKDGKGPRKADREASPAAPEAAPAPPAPTTSGESKPAPALPPKKAAGE